MRDAAAARPQCASKSLCWAAGGQLNGAYENTPTDYDNSPVNNFANANYNTPNNPLLVVSTNGGLKRVPPAPPAAPWDLSLLSSPSPAPASLPPRVGRWTVVQLPYSTPATGSAQPWQTTGALLAVASDSAGKAVYAVGAPSVGVNHGTGSNTNGGMNMGTSSSTDFVHASSPFAGEIYVRCARPQGGACRGPGAARARRASCQAGVLSAPGRARRPRRPPSSHLRPPRAQMSNSYGAVGSWALQSAPVLPGMAYGLWSVTVPRGSIAFAAGGNPFGSIFASDAAPAGRRRSLLATKAAGVNKRGYMPVNETEAKVVAAARAAKKAAHLVGVSYAGWQSMYTLPAATGLAACNGARTESPPPRARRPLLRSPPRCC